MSENSLSFDDFRIPLFSGEFLCASGKILAGERVVLMGPSGCGKSTFLRSLAGLHNAESGRILLGSDILDLSNPRQSRPGMLFQGGALFEHLSVFENCKVALDYNPEFSAYSFELKSKAISQHLGEVKLEGFEDRLCQELSGGEKQRVALVRCLLSSPQYLLLDEPLSALDSKTRREVEQLVLNLLAKKPLPTLIVSHDETEAKTLGTRIAHWPAPDSNKCRSLHF